MRDPSSLRRSLVEQLHDQGVRDERVLEAFRKVPRHLFVRPKDLDRAYQDEALPLGLGATVSQPYVVASMLEALALRGHERVLDVGSGSGYTTALLCELAAEVHAIEWEPRLVEPALRLLRELAYPNFLMQSGDGRGGLPLRAPFDAILVSAACPELPDALLLQLGPDGRLIAPVGGQAQQQLELWRRQGEAGPRLESIGLPVRFVPLR
ncbi:MAG: protein-L-isoaspartate(D-aspartate) O-methyltransferase [Planctomycetes bacterium]|nr:protein-L-isoaspartate(D-aspartate) O-methyltransferase [Planctomycetota bacterium]